jgi:hypothetical protein
MYSEDGIQYLTGPSETSGWGGGGGAYKRHICILQVQTCVLVRAG